MFASLHNSTLAIARVQARSPLAGIAIWLRQVLNLRAGRKHLITLDDARLSDIGLTRAQAMAEAARPLWDVPRGWRA